MYNIHCWKNSRTAVLQIALLCPLGVAFLGLFAWYALTDPDLTLSARLTCLVMLAIIVALLRVFVTEIVLGHAMENYILSPRTLAIVRKGRPTRYLKPRDILVLSLHSNSFKLRDGTTLSFHLHDPPGAQRSVVEKLIALWYGESEFASICESYRVAHFLPRSIRFTTFGVICCAIATLNYGGLLENGRLIWSSLAVIALVFMFCVLWISISARKFTWPLAHEGRHAGGSGASRQRPNRALRFPATRPDIGPQILAYVVLFQIATLFVPVCRFLMHIPRESGGYIFVGFFAVLGLLFTFLLVRHCYHSLVRGKLFATALLSRNTLAIFCAGEPVRYLKRKDVVAFRPSRQQLILANDTKIGLGLTIDLSDARGLMKALWNNWWSYVPETKRIVPDQSAGIRWKKGAITLGLYATGFGIMLYGSSAELSWLALPGLAFFFLAGWYYVVSLAKKGDYYQVSLRREDY